MKLNRTIDIWGDITVESGKEFCKSFNEMVSSPEPFTIQINTTGGDVYTMFAIYDLIRGCENIITTIGIGSVQSAGPLLLAAGNIRKAYSNTSFLVHEGMAIWDEGNVRDVKIEAEHHDALDQFWFDEMSNCTAETARFWKNLTVNKPDTYFYVDKAWEWGIIDEII